MTIMGLGEFYFKKIGSFLFLFLFLVVTGCGPVEESEFVRNGLKYQDREKCKEAIAEFTKEIQRNSSNAKGYLYRGTCYIRKGDLDAALKDLQKSVQIDPKLAEAYQQMSALYFAKFDYKRSWDCLRTARDTGAKIDLTLLHSLQKESNKNDEDFFGFKKK